MRVPRGVDRQAREDVASEIDFHLDMRTEELIGEGVEPRAARRMAEAEFGDRDAARRSLEPGLRRRERRERSWLSAREVWRDVRHAVRSLGRSRGFAGVAILTLAFAIGANAAIFSVANSVMLRPLPYAQPDRLAAVWESKAGESDRNTLTTANLIDWASTQRSFEVLGAYSWLMGLGLVGQGEPEEIRVVSMTPDAFRAVGVDPARGRLFASEDGSLGSPRVTVLAWDFWQRRFGGDEAVLGSTLTLDDLDYRIVGIMGPGFDFPSEGIDAWTSLRFASSSEGQNRQAHQWRVIGRLAPGISTEAADAELDAIAARLRQDFPAELEGWSANVEPFREALTSDVRPLLGLLLGVVGIVLLIACANLANLMLARHAARARELSVRKALGAGRGRLIRQLSVESALVGLAGVALGLAIAWTAMRGFVAIAPSEIPLLDEVRLDRAVLGFSLAITLLATFLFGLLPAFRASRADPADALGEGGLRSVGGRRTTRMRAAILVTQVALSVLLLVGAGLLTRSLIELQRVPYGYEPEGLLAVSTQLPSARYASSEAQNRLYEAVLDRVRAMPGVVAAAGTTEPPVVGYQMTFSYSIQGRPTGTDNPQFTARDLRVVTPEFFETTGMRVLRGRGIEPMDRADAPLVVLVNQSLAELMWPQADPIGQRISFGGPDGPWWEIVGIVNDVRLRGPERAMPAIYAAWEQRQWTWMSWMTLMIRAERDPSSLIVPVQRAFWEVDPQLPIRLAEPVPRLYARSRARNRFAMGLVVAFAALAIGLGAIGLYGVLAYSVNQRRQEIGVRMALGAGKGRIARWVMWDGARLCGLGLVIGLGGSFAMTRALGSLLFGVGPLDPWTLSSIPLVLGAVTLVAGWLPARRAARTEPSIVLREG